MVVLREAGAEMSEWQPIETAPKDGTPLRLKRGDFETYGQWHVTTWCGLSNSKHFKPAFNDAHQPTQWMLI